MSFRSRSSTRTRVSPPLLRWATVAAAALVALTGCGAAGTDTATTGAEPTTAATTSVGLTVTDPWVKTSDGPMTAVFGSLHATGPEPVTIVSAQTSASPRTELHEVVTQNGSSTMRRIEGGFVVQPGTPRVLAPGGDHIMILDLAAPIRPGDQVEVTLTLSNGSTTRFTAVAKETTAGEENYEHGEATGSDHGDDHGAATGSNDAHHGGGDG